MQNQQHYQLAMLSTNMKNGYKIILSFLCVAILGFSLYLYKGPTNNVDATSPAGSTFSNAKYYGIAINLASPGANGTSTSITNTDSNDRYVVATKIGCENVGSSRTAYTGAGLASLQISVGTTSTSAPITFSSVFPVVLNQVISTSTQNYLFASSTLVTATTSNAIVWPTGTALTFSFNATNTAACTIGVETLGS